jgi:hypothetical protein
LRVACKRYEKIESVIITCESDGILKALVHVPRPAHVRRWEYYTMSEILEIDVCFAMSNGILEAAVERRTAIASCTSALMHS